MITNTAAVSLEKSESNKQVATSHKLLTELYLISSQNASIPKKKNNASSMDGIEKTTCEFRGCIRKTIARHIANAGLKKYFNTRKSIIALPMQRSN